MKDKMFHIEIKDNSTGKVLLEADTSAIIGTFDDGARTRSMSYTNCKGKDLIAIFNAEQKNLRISMTDEDHDDTLWKMALRMWLADIVTDEEMFKS